MSKIYVVTAGEYSDYGICSIFSTREKAEQYIDTKDDDYRIKEFELDAPIVKEKKIYEVCMNIANKEVSSVKISHKAIKDIVLYDDEKSHIFRRGHEPSLIFLIESDSKERAIKVASERFGAVIANELAMFPFLRHAIIINRIFACPEIEYPMYDFYTGKIILSDDEKMQINPAVETLVSYERRSLYGL